MAEASAAYVREAGSGPAVVCLHSNSASSSQWRALSDRLAPRRRVLAPDSYGSGRSPAWPGGRPLTLADEVELLAPVFAGAGERFAVVGHSYGGAVALIAALRHAGRVAALALYEPTLFALVDRAQPPPNAVDGIRDAVRASRAAFARGERDAAARHFIDYWMGDGTWQAMPQARRAPIEANIEMLGPWGEALMGEPTPAGAFAALDVPVLLMTGGTSPASAQAVAALLARTFPNVRTIRFDALGHMGPLTHPEVVNAAIERFLEAVLPA